MIEAIFAGGGVAKAADAERAKAKDDGDFVAERKAQFTAKTGRCLQLAGIPVLGIFAAAGYGAYCYTQGYFNEIPESNA